MSNAVAVTDATFEQEVEKHDGLSVVDFWATWCGPCRIISPILDQLSAEYEGRVKKTRELEEMAAEYGEFRVYVVEVCQSCGWNHLASSYVLGTGEPAVRRRRRARTSQ